MTDFLHPQISKTCRHVIKPGAPLLHLLPADCDARVLVLWKGSILLEQGRADILLEGTLVWIASPQSPLVLKPTTSGKVILYEIHFVGQLAKEYLHHLQHLYGRTMRIPNDNNLRQATLSLIKNINAPSKTVFSWFCGLHQVARKGKPTLDRLISQGLPMLKQLAPDYGFSLKSIASELGCTTNALTQRWKSRGHPPLVKSLRHLRHNLATQLLLKGELPLRIIASSCGFSGAPAFATTFKKRTGLTPQAWRCEHLEKSEISPPLEPESNLRQAILAEEDPNLNLLNGPDERPVRIWGGPFFQFDGGEGAFPYDAPFNLALNRVTRSVSWCCTLGGSAQFEVDGQTHTFSPGSIIIYMNPMKGRWLTPSGRNWSRVWLQMRDTWSMQLMEHYGRKLGWAFQIPLNSKPVRLAREWVNQWNAGRGIPSVRRSRIAYDWLLAWEELLTSGRCTKLDFPDLTPYALNSFFRKISTITRYAQNMGYSRAHLSRLLRKQWRGGTPAQIIRRNRLAQAALDLREGREPIHEIAHRALYANPSAFVAAFKKEYGMTPRTYRYSDIWVF